MPTIIQDSNKVVQTLFMIFTGKHFGPFWFIPMITVFYLLASPLLYIDRNKIFYKYIFPVLFFAGLFLYRFGYNSSTFESFLYFLPIYTFGMWASHYRENILSKGSALFIPLVLLYSMITYLEISGVLAIGKTYSFGEELKENAFLFNFGKLKASALCLILLMTLHKLRTIKVTLWGILATYSFGIFFIHLYVIRLIEVAVAKAGVNFTFNTLLYLTHIILITTICLGLVQLVKVVAKRKSRYLIGC